MQAVIRIGSHQYNVAPGKTITVEKLSGPVGSEIRFRDVLLVGDEKDVQANPKATVVGRITEQYRGPKILVFKKKRRKGYRRKQGHRQPYTQVEITGIES